MAWSFRTVPDELLWCAEKLADHYRDHGYTVQPEQTELGYPNTPTFRARRANTTVVVEVLDRLDAEGLRRWTAFGKSSGHDFRLVVGIADDAVLTSKLEGFLRELGVGCQSVIADASIVDRVLSTDLALNVELPVLKEMPQKARKLLGPAYEKFNKGDWREGFEEACHAFEAEARRYLKRHTRTGRLKVLRKGGPKELDARTIDRLTMGQMARTFEEIVTMNYADSVIKDTLGSVNKDRVGVVHKKLAKRTEKRLRLNVGRHMWALYNGFKEVIK